MSSNPYRVVMPSTVSTRERFRVRAGVPLPLLVVYYSDVDGVRRVVRNHRLVGWHIANWRPKFLTLAASVREAHMEEDLLLAEGIGEIDLALVDEIWEVKDRELIRREDLEP